MLRTLILIPLIFVQSCLAYVLDEVANQKIKCGPHVLRFGPDALIASLNGMRMDVRWDDEGMSAEIGQFRLALGEDGTYQFDHKSCEIVD